jgi:hypothetical protein
MCTSTLLGVDLLHLILMVLPRQFSLLYYVVSTYLYCYIYDTIVIFNSMIYSNVSSITHWMYFTKVTTDLIKDD